MVPTESEVRRIFDRFQTEGFRNWPDGSAIASDELVLAFGLFLWTTVVEADEGGGEFLAGAKDPEAALTGDDGSRELTSRVNSSPVGRRYARRGDRPGTKRLVGGGRRSSPEPVRTRLGVLQREGHLGGSWLAGTRRVPSLVSDALHVRSRRTAAHASPA